MTRQAKSHAASSQSAEEPPVGGGLLAEYPWLGYLLPFIVFMVLTSFEPQPPKERSPLPDGSPRPPVNENWFGLEYHHYPIVYTLKIAATAAAMFYVGPVYRQLPLRVSPLAVVVGIVGVVLWIALCHLELERRALTALGLADWLGLGQRSAYNPLEHLADSPAWAYAFLGIRFFGLAVVVPIIEEFFLRGFLMRFVVRDDFWRVPFGDVTRASIAVGTLVPMLMHPGELLAAAVWFSLVTWLMIRTRSIWDCVVAHAVTNLLLGFYVVAFGQWQLW